MGFEEVSQISINLRPLLMDSRYSPIAFVSGSWIRYSRISHSSTSILFPMEHTLLMPIILCDMQSIRKAPESMPLWTIKETSPGINSSQITGVTKEKIFL